MSKFLHTPLEPLSAQKFADWAGNAKRRERVVMQNLHKLVKLNEQGRRVCESHPRARLTDHEVDLVHELHDAGMTLAQIAAKFDVSKGCIWKIVHGYRRCQLVVRIVSVAV